MSVLGLGVYKYETEVSLDHKPSTPGVRRPSAALPDSTMETQRTKSSACLCLLAVCLFLSLKGAGESTQGLGRFLGWAESGGKGVLGQFLGSEGANDTNIEKGKDQVPLALLHTLFCISYCKFVLLYYFFFL